MKIVVAGGSGLIGHRLLRVLLADGSEVINLTRHPERTRSGLPPGLHSFGWDARTVDPAWSRSLVDADAIINLAGASVGGRPWTKARKLEILSSRLDATNALAKALAAISDERRPKVLVNASGIDFYGDRGDENVTEQTEPGNSFLAKVCVDWENSARSVSDLGIRVVCMRTAVVLAKEAMTLRLMAFPFRFFLGGPLGTGRQWFPWIHIDDLVGMYRLAVERTDIVGGFNAVSPDIRRESEVAEEIGSAIGRPSWLAMPSPLLRILLRDQADLLLHGRRAIPAKAIALGYSFRYPNLRDALHDSLGGT